MVRMGDTVDYVLWSDAIRRRGRVVKLDENNRIKAMMFALVPDIDYAEGYILVVDTEAIYRHVKVPGLRGTMPQRCVLLKQWFHAQVFTGPLPCEDRTCCIWCAHVCATKGKNACAVFTLGVDDEAHRCSSCSMVWHSKCARRFSDLFIKQSSFFSRSRVCHLCSHSDSHLASIAVPS